MNQSKLIGTAKKLDGFFRVMQRIVFISMIVVVCVMAVLTVVHLTDPDAVIGTNFHMVDVGPLTIELAPEYAPTNRTVLSYAWIYVALAAASAAVCWYAFGQIRRILAPMTQGDPFHPSVADHIRRLSYVSIALGILGNAAETIETAVSLRLFDLSQLVDGGQIRSITANFNIDLTFLIVFFVLLLISYIFRYGAELQQLSDETL